jgi:CheY-like chemotaxis protein
VTEKKNILIICRSAAGQMYLGVLLGRFWYTPLLARTAEEGIRLTQKKNCSLIVLDGDLPDQERKMALSLLRSHAAVRDLPLIVFMTTEIAAENKALLADGCSAVITKPVDLAMLYGTVSRLTGLQRTTPRIPVKFRVVVEGTPEKELICTNLSEGGLYLRTHEPMPVKTVLHLRFALPRSTGTVSVAGEVVRTALLCTELEAEPGMGLRFVDLPDTVLLQLRNFVQGEMIGDLEWQATI